MQKILSIADVKVYSRKQIIAWVNSYNIGSFEDLKNGLFFIKILRKLTPHDVGKYKICEKPINQYEQTQNMNFVKKILNKHNLQLNLNVLNVIASKNCFQLANWFKNLYEQNKSDKDTQFHYSEKSSQTPSKFNEQFITTISNYKSLSRATSSDKNQSAGIRKLGRVTSGFIGVPKDNKQFAYTLKIPKPSYDSELTYQLYSHARLEQQNERSRTVKIDPRSAKSKGKLNKTNNWFGNNNIKKKFNLQNEEQNMSNMMKMAALEQNISFFQQTLRKIEQYLQKLEPNTTIQKMKKEVIYLIYKIQTNNDQINS